MAGKRATYEFHPNGPDAWRPQPDHPEPGTRVRLARGDGTPRRPPGQSFVEDADTGEFVGKVGRNSLERVTRKRPSVTDNPKELARMNAVINDRR